MQKPFREIIPKNLIKLASVCPFNLYIIGGSVRDHLSGSPSPSPDLDICAPVRCEEFYEATSKSNLKVQSVFKTTGTVKLSDDEYDYEFSSFRSDEYVRGKHTPERTFFTDDIVLDAKRRDFTVNAIYYDIKNDKFVDPLNDGVAAIREKRLTAADDPKKVFSEDGLRLMRLARFNATLNFSPDEACLNAAKENSHLILDIHPSRIYEELSKILLADVRSKVPYTHYDGLKTLDEIGVLEKIFPLLCEGRNLSQRPDFHKYDVLEHSLRCVRYAPPSLILRIAALFHDVGKIDCMNTNGNAHEHEKLSAELTKELVEGFQIKASAKKRVVKLVAEHMYDYNALTKESKIRRYIVLNYEYIDDILAIKQADYSACKDDLSEAPTVTKWKNLIQKMKDEGAPFSLRELNINGKDLIDEGYDKLLISDILTELLSQCAINPSLNVREKLLNLSKGIYKQPSEKRSDANKI